MRPAGFTLQLSNERMFLIWIRTATVLMGFGYAVARLALYLDEHAQAARHRAPGTYLGGLAMTLVGFVALLVSANRYGARARAIAGGSAHVTADAHELRRDNERTLVAWIRTAAALFAFGCTVAQVGMYLEYHAITPEPEVGMYAAAMLFVIVAVATVLLGLDDYHRRRIAIGLGRRRTRAHEQELACSRALYPLAVLDGIAGASLLVMLVVLY